VDEIKTKILGGSCSSYGRGEVYTWNWCGTLRVKEHLEETGLDEEIML
jgi:hypothetical protein